MAQVATAPPIYTPGDFQQEDDDVDESSVDTQDALLDMLGLPNKDVKAKHNEPETTPLSLTSILVMDDEAVDDDDPKETNKWLDVVPINLPPKCSRYGLAPSQCAAVVIPEFYSAAECQALLQRAHVQSQFQYITEAAHTAPDGSRYTVQLQNPNPHKLAVLEHPPTIQHIWNKLQPYLTGNNCWMNDYIQRTQYGPPVGLNPRLRVLQYDASDQDRFEPHFDCTTHVDNDKTSRITILLYLNTGGGEDFEGGETVYLDSHISSYNNNNSTCTTSGTTTTNSNNNESTTTKITPQRGTLVLFEHDLYHAGAPLLWGRKHVMRTDILFQDTTNSSSSSSSSNLVEENDEELQQQQQQQQQGHVLDDNSNSNNGLVSALCLELDWSKEDQEILQDMGLYTMTLEAFLGPGTILLQEILLDAGIGPQQVERFLALAQQRATQ